MPRAMHPCMLQGRAFHLSCRRPSKHNGVCGRSDGQHVFGRCEYEAQDASAGTGYLMPAPQHCMLLRSPYSALGGPLSHIMYQRACIYQLSSSSRHELPGGGGREPGVGRQQGGAQPVAAAGGRTPTRRCAIESPVGQCFNIREMPMACGLRGQDVCRSHDNPRVDTTTAAYASGWPASPNLVVRPRLHTCLYEPAVSPCSLSRSARRGEHPATSASRPMWLPRAAVAPSRKTPLLSVVSSTLSPQSRRVIGEALCISSACLAALAVQGMASGRLFFFP